MQNKDPIWLKVLSILFCIFVVLVACYGSYRVIFSAVVNTCFLEAEKWSKTGD